MASGLYNLQASVPRNLIRCLKHSCDVSTSYKSRWRTFASLSLAPGLVTGTYETKEESHRNISLRDLKKKEKGDWRNLSFEEKQTSLPNCDCPSLSFVTCILVWFGYAMYGFGLVVRLFILCAFQKHGGHSPEPSHSSTYWMDSHVYRMSFSQPLHYAVDQPADEWKVILGGTFTAMGFMMLGMYFWSSKPGHAENDIGPLSSKNKEEIRIPLGERMESVA